MFQTKEFCQFVSGDVVMVRVAEIEFRGAVRESLNRSVLINGLKSAIVSHLAVTQGQPPRIGNALGCLSAICHFCGEQKLPHLRFGKILLSRGLGLTLARILAC
jgi:hypothetical protein